MPTSTLIDPATVKPLADRILIKRIPYKHETLEVLGIRLDKGLVVAIGTGKRRKRKVRYGRTETSVEALYLEDGPETGKVRPIRVAVGKCVEFSPYKHQVEFQWGDDNYVLVPDAAVYAVDPYYSASVAVIHSRIAGYERGGSFLAR